MRRLVRLCSQRYSKRTLLLEMAKIKTKGKVGILLAGVFVILALFHVDWAFRGPPTSVQILPTIPDEPEIIPSQGDGLWISSLGVAGALFLAAIVVLASANLVLTGIPGRLRSFAGIVLGGILFFVLLVTFGCSGSSSLSVGPSSRSGTTGCTLRFAWS